MWYKILILIIVWRWHFAYLLLNCCRFSFQETVQSSRVMKNGACCPGVLQWGWPSEKQRSLVGVPAVVMGRWNKALGPWCRLSCCFWVPRTHVGHLGRTRSQFMALPRCGQRSAVCCVRQDEGEQPWPRATSYRTQTLCSRSPWEARWTGRSWSSCRTATEVRGRGRGQPAGSSSSLAPGRLVPSSQDLREAAPLLLGLGCSGLVTERLAGRTGEGSAGGGGQPVRAGSAARTPSHTVVSCCGARWPGRTSVWAGGFWRQGGWRGDSDLRVAVILLLTVQPRGGPGALGGWGSWGVGSS